MLIHICTVSGQNLPNLILALHQMPDHVIALETDGIHGRHPYLAKELVNMLDRAGLSNELRGNVPDQSWSRLVDFAYELGQELKRRFAEHTVVLNATGGTKQLVLALCTGFKQADLAFTPVYVDTEHGAIENLTYPPEPGADMPDLIDVPTYLMGQGFQYYKSTSDQEIERSVVEERSDLTNLIAEFVVADSAVLREMNSIYWRATHDGTGSAAWNPSLQRLDVLGRATCDALRQLLINREILIRDESGLRFPSVDAAEYFGGVWLEEFSWLAIKGLGFKDLRLSAKGRHLATRSTQLLPGSPDEIDVAGTFMNQMLMIECKATRALGDQAGATHLLAKIDSAGKRLGGLFGTGVLVVPFELDPTTLRRAQELRLGVVDGARIFDLASLVERWLDSVTAGRTLWPPRD